MTIYERDELQRRLAEALIRTIDLLPRTVEVDDGYDVYDRQENTSYGALQEASRELLAQLALLGVNLKLENRT